MRMTSKWMHMAGTLMLAGLAACGGPEDPADVECEADSECTAIPSPYCNDDVLVTYTDGGGSCTDDGICNYARESETCPNGCSAGACIDDADLCEGVDCSAPAPTCDGTVVMTYSDGTCSGGTCDFADPVAGEDCADNDQICFEGECVDAGACDGVVCETTPASCDGTVALTYADNSCDPETGECVDPEPTEVDCADGGQVCEDGECVDPSSCEGVTCDAPPADTCDGNSVASYEAEGICEEATGECSYAIASTEVCEGDTPFCFDGACQADDPCGDIDCDAPPADYCEGNVAYMHNAPECVAGACTELEVTQQNCSETEEYCFEGACQAADPCADITCDMPEAMCEGNTAITYTGAGACDAGLCDFSEVRTETDCGDEFCVDGACQAEDPCADITCDMPEAMCEGNTAVTYTGAGSCTAGECDFSTVREATDCGDGFCVAGACQDEDPCADVTCDMPEPTCNDAGERVSYSDAGVCAEGECDFSAVMTVEACTDGAQCVAGACLHLPTEGDLVITEFLANAPGEDDGREWFELYNTSANAIALTGITVRDDDGDTFEVEGLVEIAAGGFFVFAETTESAPGVDYTWPNGGAASGDSFTLSNSNDELVLQLGDVELDRVNYDRDAWPMQTGAATQLTNTDPSADNNDPANWCSARDVYTIPGSTDTAFGTPDGIGYDCANLCYLEACAPFDPYCDADLRMTATENGVCVDADGSCDYSAVTASEDCSVAFDGDGACADGVCINLCGEVTCDTPPASTCDVDTVVTYVSEGTCARGACSYAEASRVDCPAEENCSTATGEATCVADLCSGVTCEMRAPFCDGNTAVSDTAAGTCDSADGLCDYAGEVRVDCGGMMCSGGVCTRAPEVGDLVITEITFNGQSGSENGYEWFEVYNTSTDTISLDGMLVDDRDGGSAPHALTEGYTIPGESYFVFAGASSAVPTGEADYLYGPGAISFSNGGDSVRLLMGDTVLDEVAYFATDSGTWPTSTDGTAIALNPATLDAASNDTGDNWSLATTEFTTDDGSTQYGTPGAANPAP